jgi:hypothetical protein
MFLPGEDPSASSAVELRHETDQADRRRRAKCLGVADEAVVAVKPSADEGMATCLRRKPRESDREVGGEGRNMERGPEGGGYLSDL